MGDFSIFNDHSSYLVKNGGLGFRLLSDRFLLFNSLCNTMPLAIDQKDEKGNVTKGLWNSLLAVLGTGSFDVANRGCCWSVFHASENQFIQPWPPSSHRVGGILDQNGIS